MRTLNKVLSNIEQWFIGSLLLLITGVLFVNVVLRRLNLSLDWAEEFARYGIVWVTFIGASVCIYKGAHIGVDAITMILPKKGQKILSVTLALMSIIFTVVFTYQAFKITHRVYITNQMSSTLEVPMVYIYGVMPLSGILMIVRFSEQFILSIKSLKGGNL